eukprot:Selendium_serpulae@DN6422_c2_g1_i2.p3
MAVSRVVRCPPSSLTNKDPRPGCGDRIDGPQGGRRFAHRSPPPRPKSVSRLVDSQRPSGRAAVWLWRRTRRGVRRWASRGTVFGANHCAANMAASEGGAVSR